MNAIDNLQNTVVKNMLASMIESTKQTGARFASFTYSNKNGETSRHNVMLGVKMLSLYKSDLRTLTALRPTLTGIDGVACDELIASINNSLTNGIGKNDAYTLKGYYTPVTSSGEIGLHNDDKTGETFLYIRGYVIKKTVLVKGEYPVVKSSDKTLAKNKIEKTLKRGKIRTFKLNVNDLHMIKANGMTVEIS
jgi:hypothetical protein